MDIDWEILIHGAETAMQGHQLRNHPYFGTAAGFGIGAGAVFVADNLINNFFMNDPDQKRSPGQAMLTGVIEDTISQMALSVLLSNPLSLETIGMGALMGIPEGLAIHSLEGEVDWSHPFSWN